MKFKVNGHEVYASTGGRPFDKKKTINYFCSWEWLDPYDMGTSN